MVVNKRLLDEAQARAQERALKVRKELEEMAASPTATPGTHDFLSLTFH